MTSKNLFFKLMKEDLKRRIWAVALLSLGFFFFYPVVAAFTAGEIKEYMDYAKGLAEYEERLVRWLSFNCGMTVFLMMVASLICGLSSFSYLNSKSKVDFYHGLPVRREKLFAANFLNGILILAVPYGICQVLAVLVGISNGAGSARLWQVALAAYGLHVTYYILMYSTVVVAAMMTGHLVIAFLGTAVFAAYMPMATGLLLGYLSCFFVTYAPHLPGLLSEDMMMHGIRFSPVAEYIYQLGHNGQQYMSPEPMAIPVMTAWAVSVLLALLSGFLYRKRPSEAAGKAMAFPVTRPVIRILLTMLSSLGMGLFLYAMRNSVGWAFFGIVFGGGICHCVVEIIYHFDFRKLFSHKLQLVCCLAAAAAVFLVFRFDLLGYDRYLPKAGQVREASIHVDRLMNWVSYGNTENLPDGQGGHYEWVDESSNRYVIQNMEYHDIENLLAIASDGISRAEENKRTTVPRDSRYYNEREDYGKQQLWSRVEVCYTLNSGRKVSRSYYMPVYNEKLRSATGRLYANEEFKKGVFPLLSRTADQVAAIRFRGEYSLGDSRENEVCLRQLPDGEKAQLLETYQREFAAMTLERMESEMPIGLIRFSQEADEAGMDWWAGQDALGDRAKENYKGYYYWARNDLADKDFYPVYPSFTETIRLLEAQGVKAGGYLAELDVRAARVELNDDYLAGYYSFSEDTGTVMAETGIYGEYGNYFFIRDPERIAQIREDVVSSALCYYNPVFPIEDLNVCLMVWDPGSDTGEEREGRADMPYENGSEGDWNASVEVRFPQGQVPEFLWEKLETAQ
ncbi:hypothetical protein D3Z51_05055 [Clostridiaceae bacterium]|nr:hypothetical protein [Clostridiaceae bacterium]RKI15577.1 hypothetical protein D7V81_06045 [bacterium 1XD21-70]